MRFVPMAALAVLAPVALTSAAAPAHAQVFASSVTAARPDSAGKVPGFNKVPGSAIANWSNGLAQVILTHGQLYNYCVSLGSGGANGTASVTFTIERGTTAIQSGVIEPPGGLAIGRNGVWYVCSGYTALPNSPGRATLAGTVTFTPTSGGPPTQSEVRASVQLK